MVLWYCVKTTPAALLEEIYSMQVAIFLVGLNPGDHGFKSNPGTHRLV